MAFTDLQTATSPNVAYTRLLYTVSGSIYTGQPQFQYVCDVYNRDTSQLLKRITQPVNPGGSAIFDIARIVQGELKADFNWKINTPTEFSSSKQGFEVKLGEQFGTSISSSVTVYPDQEVYQIYCNQGVIEPNAGAYNWQQVVDSNTLSNMPATMSMQPDDFGTISAYVSSGYTVISQSFYSASSTSGTYDLVDEKNYSLVSGFDDYFWSIPISSSNQNWNYVDVSLSGSYGLSNYRYEASDETHREKTRFAFVNKLGAWDYYNNYNPVRQAIKVSREQYTAPRVDYSSRLSTYDISRRGRTDVHNSTDDVFTVDTDLLDKTNANWLEELIESPEVYIQRNGEFIPIIITDSSYIANQNQARQKQFKYTINFKPSNQPFGTWIPEYVNCPKVPSTPAPVAPVVDSLVENSELLKSSQFAYLMAPTSSGSAAITAQGLVYSSTNAFPNISSSDSTIVSQSTQIGSSGTVVAYPVSGSTSYYVRGWATNSGGTGYSSVSTTTTPADFNPIAAFGVSNPYVHYDFTRPRNINNGVFNRSLLDSNGTLEVNSVSGSTYNSLGILTEQSAGRPPKLQTNISPDNSIIYALGPYVSFAKRNSTQGDFLGVDANAVDNIFWKGGTGVNNNITQYTVLAYLQPVYDYTDNGSAIISWDGIETGGGSPITSPALDFGFMHNNSSTSLSDIYGGAHWATTMAKQIGMTAGQGGTSTRNVYSYSGSAITDTLVEPWLSQFVKIDKTGVGTTVSYTIQRGDSGPIGSGSFGQPDRDGAAVDDNNQMNFALGGEAYTQTGTGTFNIAHLVIYSGSLTQAQMTGLNDSFAASDPYLGSKLNTPAIVCTEQELYAGTNILSQICGSPSRSTVRHNGTDISDATKIWSTCGTPHPNDKFYSKSNGPGTINYWSWDAGSETLSGPFSFSC